MAGCRSDPRGLAGHCRKDRAGRGEAVGHYELYAAIGPGIGPCCYEVGPEVAAQFGEQGSTHIDLPGINRLQLIEAGVTPQRIYASNLCTKCLAAEFHSFRRDAEKAGRQYSFAGVRSGTVKGEGA